MSTRQKTFSVMFIFFILFWSACNKSRGPETNATVEVIDGVEFIHNTETPIHPDKTVLFEKDLSIRSEDEEGNIVLFDPRHFLVDSDENIYISESSDQVIKVFSPDGEYIKTIGAKGDGPGEFQSIGYLGFTPNGSFVVIDNQARRTNLFDASGQFLKGFKWQKYFSRAYLFKNKSYICQESVYGEKREVRKLFVSEIDYDGDEIRSYGEFTLAQVKTVREGNSGVTMSIPHSPQSIFAGDQNRGWLYHCLNNQYIIEVYDNYGKIFRKIDRPYEPVPFTDKDRKEFLGRYERSESNARFNEMFKKLIKVMELPKVKSITNRMLVDDESFLWLQTYEQKKEGDQIITAYDVFNSEGHYYAKVWCEIIPGLFRKGKMYRMETDTETGYRTLSRYRVVWN